MIRLLLLPWNILQNVFLVTPFIVLFVLQKCTFRFADHKRCAAEMAQVRWCGYAYTQMQGCGYTGAEMDVR